MQSQSVGPQSNRPSVINTEKPGEHPSYAANILQTQPVYAAGNTDLPEYSSGIHTLDSSDLRATSIIDSREVQAHAYGVDAINYAAAQSAARSFVDDQAHGQHQGYYQLDRQDSIGPVTVGTPVGMEELQTEIPGTNAIPYKDGEGPYGIWPNSPWHSGYSPTFTGKNYNEGCVADLWEGVWRNEKEEQVCLLFDHVDFYRLAYITTVHRETVKRLGSTESSRETKHRKTANSLNDIVEYSTWPGDHQDSKEKAKEGQRTASLISKCQTCSLSSPTEGIPIM